MCMNKVTYCIFCIFRANFASVLSVAVLGNMRLFYE